MKQPPEPEESPEVYAAVYGPRDARRLKILVPKGHALNERIAREWGAGCEEAISQEESSMPNLCRLYRQYSVAYDEKAHRLLTEEGFPNAEVSEIGGMMGPGIVEIIERPGKKSPAEELLATPFDRLHVEWESAAGSNAPLFPLTLGEWKWNAKTALVEMHRCLGKLHLDEHFDCNERHAYGVMDGIARLFDLLSSHFPEAATAGAGGGDAPAGKKWMPYFDRALETFWGLHRLYRQQRKIMQAIERRLDSIEEGLSARHLTPEEEENHGG